MENVMENKDEKDIERANVQLSKCKFYKNETFHL